MAADFPRSALCGLLLAASCAHAPALFHKGPPAIEYSLRVSPALAAIDVRVCFIGAVPRELVPGTHTDRPYVTRAWLDTARGPRQLAVVDQRIALPWNTSNTCVGYSVDARGAAGGHGHGFELERVGTALVANTALLLWRPPDWQQRYAATARVARIELPADMQLSVPWSRAEGGGYALDASALAFQAFAVFGYFERAEVHVPGAAIEIAILPGLPAATRTHVVPWLETAARTAALATGTFPRDHAQAVIVPTPEATEPVRFGSMNRGGGASVLLLLPVNAQLDALRRDWVAVHEFCHLLHPFVDREDAWLSEGLATYYQEVLRVRAGLEPERDAWRRLLEGAQLSAGESSGLATASAQMFETFSFRRVYWAGAAFALMTDVELRRKSGGKLSLDYVVRELAKKAVAQSRPWRAKEVIAEIDRIAGSQVASDLMARYVAGAQALDLQPLYRELGLWQGDALAAAPVAADAAWIRAAIMQGANPNASGKDATALAGAHE